MTTSPARTCRRRPFWTAAALLCSCLATDAAGEPIASCATPGPGWCVARRIAGDVPNGELGFRFGEPLDIDGDRRADIAAGTRFKLQQGTLQNGSAAVWSGASGARIRTWDGERPDGLFGHWVMPIPDLGRDGLADVVISSPTARVDGVVRGVLEARSPVTGEQLWMHAGADQENLGWDLALANDQNGDGRTDIFVGSPSTLAGRVYLVSGEDGTVLRTYVPRDTSRAFGWYVARIGDVDRDGHADLVAGAPLEGDATGARVGGAYVFSAGKGTELQHWKGTSTWGGFGEVVAAAPDLDGDRMGDVAVASPRTNDHTRSLPGEVRIFSSVSGKELRHWSGTQPGELFGRMVVAAGDLDGDGVDDLAIGAPWHATGGNARVGRVEFRSALTGQVLGRLGGDEADCWFGWHIRRAPDPEGRGRPALLIGSLRHPVDGQAGVGVVDLLVLRAQGTITRDERRSDIK